MDISEETMEKAKELWQRVFDAYRKAPLGTTIDEVGTPLLAIEFTNYQKRIDELEKGYECKSCKKVIQVHRPDYCTDCTHAELDKLILMFEPNPTSRKE
jgi:hypothetical protein